jgi:hypothetical protein
MFKYMWYTPFSSFFDWNCAENHSKYAVKQTDFVEFSDCYNWLSVSMENFQNFRYGLSLCLKMAHLLVV